jgi:hypothetical protein
MACSNCKKVKRDLEIAKRSATANGGVRPSEMQDTKNEVSLALQERDKALMALAGLVSSGLDFAEISKSLDVADEAALKRWASKLTFFERFIEDVMQKANIVNVSLEGQEYNAGLSVEVINLSDFVAGDVLEIDEVIRPLLLFKPKSEDAAKLLQPGRVTVKRREN